MTSSFPIFTIAATGVPGRAIFPHSFGTRETDSSGSWLSIADGWRQAVTFSDFMAVSYEDPRTDPRPGLTRMLGFMRCHLVRDSDIEHAIANNTCDNMKRRERSGELHARFGDRFTPGGSADNDMVVRRGHIGVHMEELAAEDREFCDQLVARYDHFARLNELTAKAA